MTKKKRFKRGKTQRSLVYYPEISGDVLGLDRFQQKIRDARRGKRKGRGRQTQL